MRLEIPFLRCNCVDSNTTPTACKAAPPRQWLHPSCCQSCLSIDRYRHLHCIHDHVVFISSYKRRMETNTRYVLAYVVVVHASSPHPPPPPARQPNKITRPILETRRTRIVDAFLSLQPTKQSTPTTLTLTTNKCRGQQQKRKPKYHHLQSIPSSLWNITTQTLRL